MRGVGRERKKRSERCGEGEEEEGRERKEREK